MLNADPDNAPTPAGDALAIVANASLPALEAELSRLGYRTSGVDDPYVAFTELLDRPLAYRALVISLPALYREELAIIRAVRQRLPHVDVLIAHADGRSAALAEAMRLGATGLLDADAVHRLADVDPAPATLRDDAAADVDARQVDGDENVAEPLLTADELRALLQEQPTQPPQGAL